MSAAATTPTRVEARKPPPKWDERVADLVDFVERHRGLEFKRPVPVRFLTESQFKKAVATKQGDLSRQDKADLERAAGFLRALGLIQGDAKKLLEGISAVDVGETLAFYDPDKKEVVVRGRQLDISVKVTVVHELTHVLQDQYFDLNKIKDKSGSSGAVIALIEGDAIRIEDEYVATLSESEQEAFGEALDDQAAKAEGAIPVNVPAVLEIESEAPYALGPAFVEAVARERGEKGIDAAFSAPPTSDKQVLSPTAYLDGDNPKPVAAPRLAAGETRLGKNDTLGALGLYLTLAARVDPVVALPTIDAWGGDALVQFTRGGGVCIRATFASNYPAGVDKIATALDQWVAVGPRDTASVERADGAVTFTACDPGRPAAEANVTAAGYVLGARASALSVEIERGAPLEGALCVADRVPFDPNLRTFLKQRNPTGQEVAAVTNPIKSLEAACGL